MKISFSIKNTIYIILILFVSSCKTLDSNLDQNINSVTLKPKRLQKGDTIGLVSPRVI